MVLWRPLFEGLSEGIKSPARSSVSGVGCLVPRASLLALRAILLRHGRLFSAEQLAAILKQTVLPAIQSSVESDGSPVVQIISESPAVSSIDFLVDPLPLPPHPDDKSLLMLEAVHENTTRSMGPAELMLEASFTDLRHGGDGDLTRAYILAKKEEVASEVTHEQPFPESWIATTSPIALGLISDVITEIIVALPANESGKLWSIVSRQYKLWLTGQDPEKTDIADESLDSWRPCEALVRTSCREVGRLAENLMRIEQDQEFQNRSECKNWVSLILLLFSELIYESTEAQHDAHKDLVESKEKAASERLEAETEDDVAGTSLETQYGLGRLTEDRCDVFVDADSGTELTTTVQVIALDFGGTLYRPRVIADGRAKASPASETSIPLEVNGTLGSRLLSQYNDYL